MTDIATTPMTSMSRQQPAEFVARHRRGLLRWLAAMGSDPVSAEDHCQEALLAALHHGIEHWAPKRAWSWLRTAARNFHLMQARRERRRPTRSFEDVEQAWLVARGDEDGGDAALEALRRCLDSADQRDHELLERRYTAEQSRSEMATALGIGEAGIKQALRRARTRLRHCMEQRLGASGEQAR